MEGASQRSQEPVPEDSQPAPQATRTSEPKARGTESVSKCQEQRTKVPGSDIGSNMVNLRQQTQKENRERACGEEVRVTEVKQMLDMSECG